MLSIKHTRSERVTVGGVGDGEFLRIGLIMHVPTKDNRTEAEPGLENGEELGLDHDLSTENAIQIDAGDLDAMVVLEQLCELCEAGLLMCSCW